MKTLIKRAIKKMSRLAMQELQIVGHTGDSFNMTQVEFLMAAVESIRFKETHMAAAKAIRTDLDLLTHALSKAPREGLILEFGVASGRTIRHLASLTDRKIDGFDSFEGLPETWRDGFEKGAFAQKMPTVPANVTLHKGWFSDTLPKFLQQSNEKVALLHVDCDLYSSTTCVLNLLKDRIKPETMIVFDEYFNYPGWQNHEHKAFEEFTQETGIPFRFDAFVPSHQQVCVAING
jgi:Macrocin-O-methyltransferase (TylF)